MSGRANTSNANFCVDSLEKAIEVYGELAIFNTDQDNQFTSDRFTNS